MESYYALTYRAGKIYHLHRTLVFSCSGVSVNNYQLHICYYRGTYLQALHWPQSSFLSLRRQPIHFPHRPLGTAAGMWVWACSTRYNYMHEKCTLATSITEGVGEVAGIWYTSVRSFAQILWFVLQLLALMIPVQSIVHQLSLHVYITSVQLESTYIQGRCFLPGPPNFGLSLYR